MALIKNLNLKERERYSVHDEIEATYSSFEKNGRAFLQIDSYGRDRRAVPGKQSQSIQFDRDGAFALYSILKREFHFT